MKRRGFIKALTAFAGLQRLALAEESKSPEDHVLVVSGEDREGKPFEFVGATFEVKVSGKDTAGRCVIFETTRHKNIGPPLHLHTDCDEWFFVQGGQFAFQAGQQRLQLKAGDSLLVPSGTPHTFVKTSEGDAQMIVMHQPAMRMEEYFRRASQESSRTAEAAREFAEQYGMRILGPPIS
jgi:mannose-6-phosphate isomerase-like protein (cupin superfamily)